MTMALIAQAAIHHFRQRIGRPWNEWDATHLARSIFRGIDGDIRIFNDTVRVTQSNAPNPDSLRVHYENLPGKLAAEGVDPRVRGSTGTSWVFSSSETRISGRRASTSVQSPTNWPPKIAADGSGPVTDPALCPDSPTPCLIRRGCARVCSRLRSVTLGSAPAWSRFRLGRSICPPQCSERCGIAAFR
jgi:hypothetical protein